ncbi:MAG: ABC transporter permease, partial [Gemmatimonadota bacterium]|nr:ABC transporter permease [Gemmatimonadota bacterium]
MDPTVARAAALERFGDLHGIRSECTQLLEEDRRATARRDWLDDLRQDLRFGVRSALRAPMFSLLAVVTLALGIGANAAVFGVVKSVLLDALPYADADRLIRVHALRKDGTFDRLPLSAGAVVDIAKRARSFARVGVFFPLKEEIAYEADDGPRPVTGALAGSGFFQTLGVGAEVGRTLRDEDLAPGAPRVAVLSHVAWQRLFGGNSAVVGRSVRLSGTAVTVVGVLPRGFVGPVGEVDIWEPLDIRGTLHDPIRARRRAWLGLIGRLSPGATAESARGELSALGAELAREHPEADGLVTLTSIPLRDDLVGDTRTPLLVLMASAGLVLLITCANLAGVLLSRALSRRKEFAVRVALGAGRGRLVRQLLTESTMLAVIGGVVGVALAAAGLAVLRGLALPTLPPYAELRLDPGAVVVTTVLAVLTGLAFGVAPGLSVGRSNPQGTLREETRGASEGRRARRLRGALVAGQIALCVSLLAAAGLLARSLWAMTAAPIGFNADGVLTATMHLPGRQYATDESRVRFHQQLEERLRAIPGVSGVALTSELPGAVLNRNGFTIEGAPWASEDATPFVLYASVSDDYFRTLGIPLRRGRTFGQTDRPDSPLVVVISESMARRYWPKGDAVGSRIRMGPDPNAAWIEVIGVVGDVRNAPTGPPEPIAYQSIRQDPWGGQALVVRAHGDPLTLVRPIQRELSAVDPALPLHQVRTLRARVDERLAGRRLPVLLMTAFGALALLLASVGVYAMFASMAAAREREFGVRIALGSSRRAIAALVLRQGGVWMAAGLAGGALGVVIVTRVVRDLLYGVAPFDPLALGVAVAT